MKKETNNNSNSGSNEKSRRKKKQQQATNSTPNIAANWVLLLWKIFAVLNLYACECVFVRACVSASVWVRAYIAFTCAWMIHTTIKKTRRRRKRIHYAYAVQNWAFQSYATSVIFGETSVSLICAHSHARLLSLEKKATVKLIGRLYYLNEKEKNKQTKR